MGWRFYAQRATTGEWLDTNVQMQINMDWVLSAPAAGEGLIPSGLVPQMKAADGRLVWGKWDTLLFAEEDKELAWVGICTSATPDSSGLKLTFVGFTGWLQRVPFVSQYQVWRTNVFDVVRRLVRESGLVRDPLNIEVSKNDSAFTVGDEQPPAKPKKPGRRKGQTKKQLAESDRYKEWQKDVKEWEKKYGEKERFEIVWWEEPLIGEEIDTLAKESNFDYRERVRWVDRGELKYQLHLELSDHLVNRRTDIEFIDGQNIAEPLAPDDGDDVYANAIIGVGAGEGRKMVRARAAVNDGRLYQADFVQYKSVRVKERMQRLVDADLVLSSAVTPKIENVVVWDVPGFASTSTLRTGDEVKVSSTKTDVEINSWYRVIEISRDPMEHTTVLKLEQVT